jgi:hypothetical protein
MYAHYIIFIFFVTALVGIGLYVRFLDHNQTTTFGKTPPDEGLDHRRDLST